MSKPLINLELVQRTIQLTIPSLAQKVKHNTHT